LAGGTGSRLSPLTTMISKQLLPIYDKPMIYYPLSTLMLAGVNEVLIVTNQNDQSAFEKLLGDGSNLGIQIKYITQSEPKGIADGLLLGKQFVSNESFWFILGDNVFHGVGLGTQLREMHLPTGANIFTYEVADPSQYGVLMVDDQGSPIDIIEKPLNSVSNLAITGLYHFDNEAFQFAERVNSSSRGELEITDLLKIYMNNKRVFVHKLSRGTAWLDTGSTQMMHDASTYIRVLEERSGLKIGCLEEIALRNEWITPTELTRICSAKPINGYWNYLRSLCKEFG